MSADDIVEAIMAQHWDLYACPCWICVQGRAAGLHVWDRWLPYKMTTPLAAVHVDDERAS